MIRRVFLVVVLIAMVGSLRAADESFDRAAARRVYQKVQAGETLTADEKVIYEKIRVMLAKRTGRSAPEENEPVVPFVARTSTGLIPLTDMSAADRYKGEDGGLYGGGSNVPPPEHLKAALAEAAKVQPLDA